MELNITTTGQQRERKGGSTSCDVGEMGNNRSIAHLTARGALWVGCGCMRVEWPMGEGLQAGKKGRPPHCMLETPKQSAG
jgi:hypothetical protein